MHLLHFHFESTLRAVACSDPQLLQPLQRVFNSHAYLVASPAERLSMLDEGVAGLARANSNLLNEDVFQQVVKGFINDLAQSGVRHVDLRIGVTDKKGSEAVSFERIMHIFSEELATNTTKITIAFLAAVNLHKSYEELDAIFDRLYSNRTIRNAVVGLDINLLPKDFAKFKLYAKPFRDLQSQGKKINLHLGELFSNDFSRTLLSFLTPDRIGHGVLLLQDEDLVSFIRTHTTCLDMCPTSNTALGVIDWRKHNPARQALRLGIPVSINTDDPLLFRTTIAQEFALARFSADEAKQIKAHAERYSYAA